jgi:hypothetical protein
VPGQARRPKGAAPRRHQVQPPGRPEPWCTALEYAEPGSGGVRKSDWGFVANALADAATLWDLKNRNGRGRPGRVEPHDDQNLFVPDWHNEISRNHIWRQPPTSWTFVAVLPPLRGRADSVCCNPITAIGNCAAHTLFIVPFRGGNRMLIFDDRVGRGLLFGDGFMRTYLWQDGRVLGFDAVEWLAWIAALNVLALITLVI